MVERIVSLLIHSQLGELQYISPVCTPNEVLEEMTLCEPAQALQCLEDVFKIMNFLTY